MLADDIVQAVQQLEVVATTASVPAMIHIEQDSPSVLGPRLYSEIVSNGSTTETSLPHVDSTRLGDVAGDRLDLQRRRRHGVMSTLLDRGRLGSDRPTDKIIPNGLEIKIVTNIWKR